MLWGSLIAPYAKAVLEHPRGDTGRYSLAVMANLPGGFVSPLPASMVKAGTPEL